jgi:hypothetical protein
MFQARPPRTPDLLLLFAVAMAACAPPPVTSSSGAGEGGGAGAGGSAGKKDGGLPPVIVPSADGGAADKPACQPATCVVAGGKYCGKIGDGCGGTLECGDCPMGDTCGGGGTAQVCGRPPDPNCKPITCQQVGGRLCGRVGNGCGGSLECGDCPGGTKCGTAMANVCGGRTASSP